MIEGLVSGKLHGRPEQRTGKNGKPFTVAKVWAAASGGESVFVNVVAFSESAQAALLALEAGDAVALAGTLTPKAWTDREGAARPALDMVAAQLLTTYHLKRKRDAVAAAGGEQRQPPPQQQAPAHGDLGPEDDDWLRGDPP